MNHNSESEILNELNYNSYTLKTLFNKEKNKLNQKYGNKWLLCTVINGKIQILQSSNERGELEENGFSLNLNTLFDVLNPSINVNYKRRIIS
jgi:hypothetical protein